MSHMPIMDWEVAVPFEVLNEKWAQLNHHQSLRRLAERGGLSPAEAAAIIEQRGFHPPMPVGVALGVILKAMVAYAADLKYPKGRPFDAWHEDIGPVLWWQLPVREPPYVGTPLDAEYPYHRVDPTVVWTPLNCPREAS